MGLVHVPSLWQNTSLLPSGTVPSTHSNVSLAPSTVEVGYIVLEFSTYTGAPQSAENKNHKIIVGSKRIKFFYGGSFITLFCKNAILVWHALYSLILLLIPKPMKILSPLTSAIHVYFRPGPVFQALGFCDSFSLGGLVTNIKPRAPLDCVPGFDGRSWNIRGWATVCY